jgi:type IV pilus assembly protein PilQ
MRSITKIKYWKRCLLVMLTFITVSVHGQDRFKKLQTSLQNLGTQVNGLNENVEMSVSGNIQDFLQGIAATHNLNVSVDPEIKVKIVNNFTNAKVADVFVYLCKQHNLNIEFMGSIMAFKPYFEEPEPIAPYRKPKVSYNDQTDFLSMELKKDTLDVVLKEISKASLKHVIPSPEVKGKMVSLFVQNRPFESALESMAYANGLEIEKTRDNVYRIKLPEQIATGKNNKGNAKNKRNNLPGKNNENIVINVDPVTNLISVEASNVPVTEIIAGVSKEAFKNYFLYNEPKGNASLMIQGATYDEFLSYLLNGSEYTFKNEDDVYLVGERSLEGLRTTKLVQLENRTIESVLDVIPAELKKGIEIKEFVELNGLIMSGSYLKIHETEEFIRQIDQVVPMVMIEVIIVDSKKTKTVSTGISAGIGQPYDQTTGSLLPSPNFQFTSESINSLINGLNGFGLVNLGQVVPDFYLSIRALEADGIINTRSTPKLATLNGHEANLKIGQTDYYLEVQNQVAPGANTTIVSEQQLWKSVNADLSITIKPFVSSDEQVTLDIKVEQSDFTGRVAETAPPGSVTRNFQSMVRVKNNEMILLGGLEEKSKTESGSGVPLLSRIPIIKWFFSNKSNEKSKSKLNIFIKPTILY